MKIFFIFIMLFPILGYSQNENTTLSPTYTDIEISRFITITQDCVVRPISDEEILKILADAGWSIEEYKALLSRNNFGLEAATKTQPISSKEIKLANLIAEKNEEKAREKQRFLVHLCEKYDLSIAKYKAIKAAIEKDEVLKLRVIKQLKNL